MISGILDHRPRIDVRTAARAGALEPGAVANVPLTTLDGDERGAVTVSTVSGAAIIEGRWGTDGGVVRADVDIEHTACALGGHRPWWRCPRCVRRTALLYVEADKTWACRRCAGLDYACRYEPRLGRLALRVHRLRKHLGPNRARPRGMRWSRYLRHLQALEDAEATLRRALGPLADRHSRLLEKHT